MNLGRFLHFSQSGWSDLKVVVRARYGAYFVAHVFKYLVPNFASGRPA